MQIIPIGIQHISDTLARVDFDLLSGSTNNTGMDNKCLWFNNDALKHRVNTEALMQSQHLPINSLDASGPYVVVGGDSEAIYVMSNVIM